MKILLSDITDEGLELDFEETVESEALKILSPARVMLRVDKVGSEVFIRGEVKTEIGLQCGRCLRNFSSGIAAGINVVYHPVEELKGEERHEIKGDELDTGFYKGEELDLQELILEQILLSVPMKPLCSESCKGICPKCGTDLNVDMCACESREPDARLAVLKKLLDERKE